MSVLFIITKTVQYEFIRTITSTTAFFAYIDAFTLRSSVFEFHLFLAECLDLREQNVRTAPSRAAV